MSSVILIYQHIKNSDSCEVKKWISSLFQYEKQHLNVYACLLYSLGTYDLKVWNLYSTKMKWHTRWAKYIQHNVDAHSHTHCYLGKAMSIIYSECVPVVLVIWHAKHMHHIILSPVVCLAVPYFSTLSHKWHEVIEHKMYILIFSTYLILPRIQWGIFINVHQPPCKGPVILVQL
jgi:hypothetical protein